MENIVNSLIKDLSKYGNFDASKVSDGYHTFEELYEHRYELFLQVVKANKKDAWIFLENHDGTKWKNWIGVGIFKRKGCQITYHLPIKYLDRLDGIEVHVRNPYYDGHTSQDVLNRLKQL